MMRGGSIADPEDSQLIATPVLQLDDEATGSEDEAQSDSTTEAGDEVPGIELVETADAADDGTASTEDSADAAVDPDSADDEAVTDDAADDGTASVDDSVDAVVEEDSADSDTLTDDTEHGVDKEDESASGDGSSIFYAYIPTMTDHGITVTRIVIPDPGHSHDLSDPDGVLSNGSDDYTISCVPINERQHRKTSQHASWTECELCGYYVNYEVQAPTTADEDHNWDDSECVDCSYECEHQVDTWETDPDIEPESLWVPLDEKQHQRVTRTYQIGTCLICQADVPNSIDEPVGNPEDHDPFVNGLCPKCDYQAPYVYEDTPCPGHPEGHHFVKIRSYIAPGDVKECKSDDDVTHTITGYTLTVVYRCDNEGCIQEKTEKEEHPSDTAVARHSYSNANTNRCLYCGYVKILCAHPNAYVTYEEYEDSILDEAVTSNGDGTHSGKLLRRTGYECPDCGQGYETYTVVTETSPCIYAAERASDGTFTYKCSGCGALCTHPHAQQVSEEQSPYDHGDYVDPVDLGNGKHQYAYYYEVSSTYCPDCKQEIDDPEYTRVDQPYEEAHSWTAYNHQLTFMPQCDRCTAVKSECLHKTQVDGEASIIGYRTKDDTEHYTVYAQAIVCQDCGEMLYTRSVSKPEAHDWSQSDFCVCGAVKPAEPECQHPNATFTESSVTTVKDSGDDDTHDEVTVTTKHWTCPDCGEEWDEAGDPVTEKTPHTYENGVCTTEGCGHVCTHAKKELGEPIPGSYTADDATHTPATITPWICPSCTMTGSDPSGEGTPEKHTYVEQDDGSYKCSVCEHVCGHSNADVTTGEPENVSFDMTQTTHTRKYQQTVTTTCPDCGYTNSETVDKTDPEEPHVWDNGVCSVCQYACVHEWVDGEPETTWSGEYDDAAVTPTQHTEKGTETTPKTCGICGVTGDATTKDVTRQQDHTWVDGVCSACNYACAHEWVDGEPQTEWSGVYDETAVTPTEHTETGVTTTPKTCSICGLEGEASTEDTTRALPHEWRDGVCAICGYECVHEDHEPVIEPGVFVQTGVTSNGASGHTLTGRLETHKKCGNCGLALETTVTDENATRTEQHSMVNGVCSVCGYKAPVEPKPEPTEQPVADDEPLFTATGDRYGMTYGTRMGTALCQAVSGIQAQDSAASIRIWKAEAIIGDANAAALDTLPAQEKVLVMLSVLGYDTEVNNTLSELNITLSPEATQQIDACRSYIGALSGDALTAYNDAKAKYFPGTASETTLTLEIASTRLERYSFAFQDGMWIYTGLTVSE